MHRSSICHHEHDYRWFAQRARLRDITPSPLFHRPADLGGSRRADAAGCPEFFVARRDDVLDGAEALEEFLGPIAANPGEAFEQE